MAPPTPDIFFDYEHFTLMSLERIVPVGETEYIGEMKATLLSIECYAKGFVAVMLIESPWQRPDSTVSRTNWEPPPLLRGGLTIGVLVDDRGNRYSGRQRAGSGGGQGDGAIALRNVYCFAPALAPDARSLTFTFALLNDVAYDRQGAPVWNSEQVLGGPSTAQYSLA